MSFTQGMDTFLDKALTGNEIVLWIFVGLFGLTLLITLLTGRGRVGIAIAGFTFLLVVGQLIGWVMNYGMAHYYGPTGVTNYAGFWALTVLTVLACLGSTQMRVRSSDQ